MPPHIAAKSPGNTITSWAHNAAICAAIFFLLVACAEVSVPSPVAPSATASGAASPTAASTATPSIAAQPSQPVKPASPSLTPTTQPRLLTICLGQEPNSLFLYDATTTAARSVLEALYDGPFDTVNFNNQPAVLENKPTLQTADLTYESVTVTEGQWIVDANGQLATLASGARYRPTGCAEESCALDYAGGAVQMDRLAVTFRLRPGIQWSDGAPLTAADSIFSYEVAAALYPQFNAERLLRTAEYIALDASTIVWRGIPGYFESLPEANFYTPLPRHKLAGLSIEALRSGDAARSPLGWGAYVIEEWTPGDHITLRRNPLYFRHAEALPHFENLVFRFVSGADEALDALLSGECDVVDPSASLEFSLSRVNELAGQGKLAVTYLPIAWEGLFFDTAPLDSGKPALLQQKEVRQAIAFCIARPELARALLPGAGTVPQAYLDPAHPLAAAGLPEYGYDPAAGAALLDGAGWVDSDGDPATARVASGVPGIPEGVPLELDLLTLPDGERPTAAQAVQQSLSTCGIAVNISTLPAEELFAASAQGPLFGRKFDLAQFAFPLTLEPGCWQFTSSEIPGPPPRFPKGWGGVNVSGYTNPAFDDACRSARASLWGSSQNQQAHALAQSLFAEDLPVLPLYIHYRLLVSRPDLCGLQVDASVADALWNLENLDYGAACR